MTELSVQRPGPRTTVQDLGRPGYAHLGVPQAGAADRAALRDANRSVGNDDHAAALEVTVGGLVVTAAGDLTAAVVGAPWTIDGDPVDVEAAVLLRPGATVAVGTAHGVYAYLAVAGGIDVPPV